MFVSSCNKEAELYYLYMKADGNISDSEKKVFNKICKELNLDSLDKKEVIKRCNEITAETKNMFSVIVSEKLDEEVGKIWSICTDGSTLARIIWNLVMLGYADEVFSEEEKRIVEFLVDKWAVSREVYQEFIDTADTMLALDKQKNWAQKSFDGSERDKKEKEIKSEIRKLLRDVKLTIDEITM